MMWKITKIAAAAAALPFVLATSYPLLESWSGSSFMNGFTYPAAAYDNTTNGDVFWATPSNTSLIYATSSGTVIMKVDNTTSVPYNDKRYSPKVLSKTAYNPGTVWVFDALHLPYGCSVWPAVWTQGPDWPEHGEIDIMEGINLQTTNQIALHTEGSGCLASTSSITGDLTFNNCSIDANSGSGCTINDTNTNSYGAGFAAAGGGVYVAEFATEYIKIWFFTRSSVPSSISSSASSIDTSSFGTPVAEYDASSCDFETYFGPQTFTIDITLCGDFAGVPSLLEETCPPLIGTNTCYTTYVINDAEATYANAYFEINYFNVYSNSTNTSASEGSTSGSGGTGGMTGTLTVGPSGTASGKSSGSSGAGTARTARTWEGAGVGLLAAVLVGGLAGLGVLL